MQKQPDTWNGAMWLFRTLVADLDRGGSVETELFSVPTAPGAHGVVWAGTLSLGE